MVATLGVGLYNVNGVIRVGEKRRADGLEGGSMEFQYRISGGGTRGRRRGYGLRKDNWAMLKTGVGLSAGLSLNGAGTIGAIRKSDQLLEVLKHLGSGLEGAGWLKIGRTEGVPLHITGDGRRIGLVRTKEIG